jgi:hypothetical protein
MGEVKLDKIKLPMILILFFLVNEYARPDVFAEFRIVLIIEVFFLWLILTNADLFKLSKEMNILWLLFISELFLHVFIASNNYWAFEIFKAIVSYFLFFLMVSYFVNTRKKMNFLFLCFVLINVYCAVIGIMNGGLIDGNAFMRDENDFALAMNISLPITLYFSFTLKGVQRYLLWGGAFLMFLAGVLSLSRGGMLGIAVVLFLIWLKSNYKVLALAFLIVAGIVFFNNMPDEYRVEMNSIVEDGTTSGTGRERIEFWKASTRIFLGNPVLGIGQGNIPFQIGDYTGGDPYWQREGKRPLGGRVVHSIYFTLIAELGLFGIVTYSLFVKLCGRYYKAISTGKDGDDRLLVDGVMIAFAAYFVTGAFLSVLYYPHFWILMALLNSLWMNRNCSEGSQAETSLDLPGNISIRK